MDKARPATEEDLVELGDTLFRISLSRDGTNLTSLWNIDLVNYMRKELPPGGFMTVTYQLEKCFTQFIASLNGGVQ